MRRFCNTSCFPQLISSKFLGLVVFNHVGTIQGEKKERAKTDEQETLEDFSGTIAP